MDNVVEMFGLTKRYDENVIVIDLYLGVGEKASGFFSRAGKTAILVGVFSWRRS